MLDGLQNSDDWTEVIRLGSYISGTAAAFLGAAVTSTAAAITTGSITNVAATVLKKDGNNIGLAGAGSPTVTFGKKILSGYNAVDAGSSLWLVFPSAFSETPNMVICNDVTTDGWATAAIGSWSLGSVYIEAKTASANVQWIAMGTE